MPGIARWLAATFGIEAKPVREVGLRDADAELRRIFTARFRQATRLLEGGESLVEIGPV